MAVVLPPTEREKLELEEGERMHFSGLKGPEVGHATQRKSYINFGSCFVTPSLGKCAMPAHNLADSGTAKRINSICSLAGSPNNYSLPPRARPRPDRSMSRSRRDRQRDNTNEHKTRPRKKQARN